MTVRSLTITCSFPAVLVLALLAAGCGGASTPTAPTATAFSSTELFSGSLSARGSSFYSFSVAQAGTVSLTLTTLSTSRFAPSAVAVGLGVGFPAGDGCSLSNSVNATPALTAQLVDTLQPGVHCVEIRDIGTLTGPMGFTVRIVHR